MSAVIEIKNLTKQYGSNKAVNNLSLSINQGEIFGFLGPNGAGKSTTIKSVMNFICPTSGNINIFGIKNSDLKLKDDIGYLSGEVSLYKKLTVKKTIHYFSNFCKVDKTYLKKLISNFDVDTSKKLGDLSKGNRQKVGLILSLMNNPKLLIVDEPTDGLDPLMQEAFYQILKDRSAAGKTTFMSSHNLSEVDKICTSFAFINHGKLIDSRQVDDLKKIVKQKYEVVFGDKMPTTAQVKNFSFISDFKFSGNKLTLGTADVNNLIKFLVQYDILSLDMKENKLEDIFLEFYSAGDKK